MSHRSVITHCKLRVTRNADFAEITGKCTGVSRPRGWLNNVAASRLTRPRNQVGPSVVIAPRIQDLHRHRVDLGWREPVLSRQKLCGRAAIGIHRKARNRRIDAGAVCVDAVPATNSLDVSKPEALQEGKGTARLAADDVLNQLSSGLVFMGTEPLVSVESIVAHSPVHLPMEVLGSR